jgi:hypothetical protein
LIIVGSIPATAYGPPSQAPISGFGGIAGPTGGFTSPQGNALGGGIVNPALATVGVQQPALQGPSSGSSSSSSSQQDESQEGDYSAIPGEPEIDYPIFSEIPETSFDCSQQEYPGYYADVEARCQVFHICALNKTFNFLCPNGTIFSQEHLVCVWWNQFDCNSAPGLFANNANLYDNTQTGQQGQSPQDNQIGTGPTQPGIASDFPTAPGIAAVRPQQGSFGGNYPAAGQPQQGSFGGNYPAAGQPTATGAGYQPSGPAVGNYPSSIPTGQGSYPTVPSNSYQPPQSDSSYPAPGQPQTTPSRDYLPPRQG